MRRNIITLSLWEYNHVWFQRVLKNTTTDAAQCRYAFFVERQSCMISTNVEKHHDRFGLLSLCFRCGKTIRHDFCEFEKHHDRCGSMSLCFRCGKTIMNEFYECWKTPRPMRPNVAMLSLWKDNHEWVLRMLKNTTTDAAQCYFAFAVERHWTLENIASGLYKKINYLYNSINWFFVIRDAYCRHTSQLHKHFIILRINWGSHPWSSDRPP
jgi:hypothetical protein